VSVATARLAENPFSAQHLQDPYAPLAALRQGGPVCVTEHYGGVEAWLILGYEEARAALLDPNLSTDPRRAPDLFRRAGLILDASEVEDGPTGLLTSDPPDHTRLRKLVVRALAPRAVERLRGEIQRTVDELLDRIAPAGRADLVASFAFPLPVIVVAGVLGIPSTDHDAFRTWTLEMQTPPSDPDAEARKRHGHHAMHEYLRRLIRDRRARRALSASEHDLGAALIASADEHDELSESELVALFMELLIGGYETVANFIANAILVLLGNSDAYARLRAQPELIPAAVEELLRFEGSVLRAVPRVAIRDVQIGDAVIPTGSLVTIVLAAANRDPASFAEPDRLTIDPHPRRHLAFGHGIHFCPGAGLARLELELALSTLLRRFPDLRLDAAAEIRWRPAGIMRALEALPVSFAPSAQ
jgi:cytochrome P450